MFLATRNAGRRRTGRTNRLLILLGLASILAAPLPARAAIKKGPYLIYPGSNTQMTVLWQLTTSASCQLEWGLDTAYGAGNTSTTEYGGDHQHKHTITNLTPSAKYYYRMTEGGTPHTGTFRTAPPDDATNTVLLVYGDTRSRPADEDKVHNAMLDEFASYPDRQTLALHDGDWVNKDTDNDWGTQFFSRFYANTLELHANLPINGCIGNHEASGVYYEKYYPYPYVADHYWSFDYGPAHVTVVDAYTDWEPGTAAYTWLTNDLAVSSKPWKFAILHPPGYGAGPHPDNIDVRNWLQPACIAYDVSMVFAGHSHNYARAEADGIIHIVTGGGGAELYDPTQSGGYVVTAAKKWHFCIIRLLGNRLSFVAKDHNRAVIDNFTITRPENLYVAFAAATSEALENTGAAAIDVRLSRPASGTVTVDYAATGGTASNTVDFSLAAGTLTFSPGSTSRTLVLTLLDDAASEGAETVVVSLDNPVSAGLGSIPDHTLTIQDNDAYIFGTVTDSGGTPVAGATVAYQGTNASGSVTTELDGEYTIRVDPDTYELTVTAPGYITAVQGGITVPPIQYGVDFELVAAHFRAEPERIAERLRSGRIATRALHLINAGSTSVVWTVATGLAQGYTVSDSRMPGGPAYAWLEISGTGTPITGLDDDTNVGAFPIGFAFPFFGQSFTTFRLCSNGFITFTDISVSYDNVYLPSALAPKNLLAALWADLLPLPETGVYYQTVDADTLVIEFKDMGYYVDWVGEQKATFQIVLKSDGSILYQYQRIDIQDSGTIGIQNEARDEGVVAAFKQAYATDRMAVRFWPDAWLSAAPLAGTTAPGAISPVTLTFDAEHFAAGTYATTLDVTTDITEIPALAVPVSLTVSSTQSVSLLAYNDLAWFPGQLSNNITMYTSTNGFPSGVHTGMLKDCRTGRDTDVTLSVAGGAGVYDYQGAHPAAGSDAYTAFDGRVDGTGVISYGTDDLVLTLTGMDPAARYELVLYADRNGADYVGGSARYHYGTLEGADSFRNASTQGTSVTNVTQSCDTTVYNAGYNNPFGYLTRYTDIAPGADGSMALRLKRDVGLAYYPYANALMLKALSEAPASVAKVDTGAQWRYLPGTAEASAPRSAWRRLDFDDSGWASGDAPFGYGGGPYGTTLADMQNSYSCVFFRRAFVVDSPSRVTEIRIEAAYDDAFVLWINGEEAGGANVAGLPGAAVQADTLAVQSVTNTTHWTAILAGTDLPILAQGTNLAAVQVFNDAAGSEDFLFDLQLALTEGSTLPPSSDRDLDGMDDLWENACFGSTNAAADTDFDGDGMANMAEFIAGSHPTQDTDWLQVDLALSNGQIRVRFPTVEAAGTGYELYERYYSLEERGALNGDDAWQGIPGWQGLHGTGQTVTYDVPAGSTTLFYRVKVWLESE